MSACLPKLQTQFRCVPPLHPTNSLRSGSCCPHSYTRNSPTLFPVRVSHKTRTWVFEYKKVLELKYICRGNTYCITQAVEGDRPRTSAVLHVLYPAPFNSSLGYLGGRASCFCPNKEDLETLTALFIPVLYETGSSGWRWESLKSGAGFASFPWGIWGLQPAAYHTAAAGRSK